jgi:hypothetical protein
MAFKKKEKKELLCLPIIPFSANNNLSPIDLIVIKKKIKQRKNFFF